MSTPANAPFTVVAEIRDPDGDVCANGEADVPCIISIGKGANSGSYFGALVFCIENLGLIRFVHGSRALRVSSSDPKRPELSTNFNLGS